MPHHNGMLYGKGTRHIPTELLVYIFSLTLPDHENRHHIAQSLLPPFTLSQVCHSWRTLVLNNPCLWSDIDTTIHGMSSARAKRSLQLWASRAGDLPISICHTPYIFDGLYILFASSSSSVYQTETTAFMEALASIARRLKHVALNVLNTEVLEPLLRLINTERHPESNVDGTLPSQAKERDALSTFPLLEELEVSSTHVGILADEMTLESVDIACPRLRRLTLLAPATVPGKLVKEMQSMQCLDLKFVTALSHLHRWIDICPNLIRLSVGLFCADETGEDGEGEQLEHEDIEVETLLDGEDEGWVLVSEPLPRLRVTRRAAIQYHLRHLTVLNLWSCSSPGNLASLLDSLETPSLSVFRIATSVVSQANARLPSVLEFLQRSRPRLVEFECSGPLMVPEDVRASLTFLPALRVLKLGKSKEVDAVLSYMIPSREGEVLCPKLEDLSLEESTFSMDVLACMVGSRCGAIDTGDFNSACERLRTLKMGNKFVDVAKEHPIILECVSRGLKVEM